MRHFKFEKDKSNRWFVVLPEWEGPHDDLEMVCGADTLCDLKAQGDGEVEFMLETEFFPEWEYKLDFIEEEAGGGWYGLTSANGQHTFKVWLCYVTIFVFGELPKTFYIA
jgi:hypothetical protein